MVNQEDAERNGALWVKGGEKQTPGQVEILSELDWKLGGGGLRQHAEWLVSALGLQRGFSVARCSGRRRRWMHV